MLFITLCATGAAGPGRENGRPKTAGFYLERLRGLRRVDSSPPFQHRITTSEPDSAPTPSGIATNLESNSDCNCLPKPVGLNDPSLPFTKLAPTSNRRVARIAVSGISSSPLSSISFRTALASCGKRTRSLSKCLAKMRNMIREACN